MGLLFESSFVDISLILTALFLFLYYISTKTFYHWEHLGIKYIKPVPFFGNIMQNALGQKFSGFLYQEMYNVFPDEKYFGTFSFTIPTLIIKDPQLITRVMVKDFSHFYNRATQIDEKLDPLNAHLVFLTDQRWKNLRNKLTPVFTSGKLKTMYSQVEECASQMEQFFHESISSKNNLLEMRECMAKFTTDVIGSCAFGQQFNALKDPDSLFRKMGRQLFTPPTFISHFNRTLRLLLTALDPRIPRLLNLKSISSKTEQFYINFIKDTIRYREKNNIKRNDFIQMMMEIRKEDASGASEFVQNKYTNGHINGVVNKDAILDDTLMTANIFVFFVAGFETTASTMAYCLLELAANLDIQEKMRQEILDAIAEHDGNLTYDIVKNLRYMDQVISETLRKYPVATALSRRCSKTYQLPDSGCIIEKGTNILIPSYAIHHDPQYYPEPDRFDPDRFSEENIKTRPEGIFLPFGDGPRICIGQRFALMEMRANFCRLLPKFEFRLSDKMKYPLEYNRKNFLLTPVDGIWLNVYER